MIEKNSGPWDILALLGVTRFLSGKKVVRGVQITKEVNCDCTVDIQEMESGGGSITATRLTLTPTGWQESKRL